MSTTAETKQNHGVSQVLKNRFVQGILASALFLQVGIWVVLCDITLCYGNDER